MGAMNTSRSVSIHQVRFWLDWAKNPNSPRYNEQISFKITGEFDELVLAKSLQVYVHQVNIFCRYLYKGVGETIQALENRNLEVNLEKKFYEKSDFQDQLKSFVYKPFDLENGPLFRFGLFRSTTEVILVSVFHHFIVDGLTYSSFGADISEIYQAILQAKPVRLKTVSPDGFMSWEKNYYTDEKSKEDQAYWRRIVNNQSLNFDFPSKVNANLNNGDGCSLYEVLSKQETDLFNVVVKKKKCSPFAFLASVFSVLLSIYTNKKQIRFSFPVNIRPSSYSAVRGCFINNLPFLADVNPSQGIDGVIQRAKALLAGHKPHQYLPLDQIIQTINSGTEVGGQSVFEVNLAETFIESDHSLTLGQAKGCILRVPDRPIVHKLSLGYQRGEKLNLRLDYHRDSFDRSFVTQFLSHFKAALIDLLNEPEKKISDIEYLSANEKQSLLFENNSRKTSYDTDICVHELFELSVKRKPEAIAIEYGEQKVTYRELDQRANQLANYLILRGIIPEKRVGIMMRRSIDAVVAFLAVMKSNGAFVPLDPDYPVQRLEYMINDSEAEIVLTQTDLLSYLPETKAELLCLDTNSSLLIEQSQKKPVRSVSSDQLVYIIYTSGSTGRPKGVMIEHRGFSHYVQWASGYYQAHRGCGAPVHSSLAFDLTMTALFVPLLHNKALHMIPDNLGIEGLVEALKNHQNYSLVKITPAHLKILQERLNVHVLNNLNTSFVIGGEALYEDDLSFIKQHSPNSRFFNEYGATETSVACTVFEVKKEPSSTPIVSVGKAIGMSQMYVLGENMRLIPRGVVGEIHLSGIQISRGYLKKDEITKRSFLKHPYFKNAVIYKTGDLGRLHSDGNVEYLGRIDNQIKINGCRVELGEIENTLAKHPLIKKSVIAVQENNDDKKLISYFTASAPQVDSGELERYLRNKLPDYMVPRFFVQLESMPLTSNGKIDKNSLPKPDLIVGSINEYVEPVNSIESDLCDLWKQILNLDKVGAASSFFRQGGHSLSALRLSNEIKNFFNVEFSMKQVFDLPTIKGQAAFLNEMIKKGQQTSLAVPLQKTSKIDDHPLSFSQQRLWFLNEYEEGKMVAYNTALAFDVRGVLDISILETTLNLLIERHEILRTRFYEKAGEVFQSIQSDQAFVLEIIESDESTVETKLLEECHSCFDLNKGPLFKVKIYRIATEHHILLFNKHHIITDGWSWGIMLEEMSAFYNTLKTNQSIAVKRPKFRYVDYVAWQRKLLQNQVLNDKIEFWKGVLTDFEYLQLPTDFNRPKQISYKGDRIKLTIDPQTLKKLKAIAIKNQTTLFNILLAAFSIQLSYYSGQRDIVVGSPVANRLHSKLGDILGFFTNTLVFRNYLDKNMLFLEFLKQVSENTLKTQEHQDLPFEYLVDLLNTPRDTSRSPVFQVMFVLQNASKEYKLDFSGTTVSRLPINYETSKFDLTLDVEELTEQLELSFEYNTDLFVAETIERMGSEYVELVQSISNNPGHRIRGLNRYPPKALAKFKSWNETKYFFPNSEKLIHELFEEQVRKTPDNIAVVFMDKRISYRELSAFSNRIGHKVRNLGARPNELVGVVMEKGWEQVAAVLGILKAGSAYLPALAKEPSVRLKEILQQGEVAIVLTQKKYLDDVDWPKHITVIAIDDGGQWCNENESPLTSLQSSKNLAYNIFTSGTSGKPKGVMIDHRGAVNTLLDVNKRFNITEQDCILALSALNFDLSVYDFFGVLAVGGKIVIPHEETYKLPETWCQLIIQERVTLWNTVPAFMQMLIEHVSTVDTLVGLNLTSLRTVLLSGDWIPLNLPDQIWRFAGKETEIVSLGGATEGSIWSILFPLSEVKPDWTSIPYGRPMRNQKMYILDENLDQVPIGVRGDLYIGGLGVAKGYWKNEEQTKNSFITHPLTGEYLYKTGDTGRYKIDGVIEFMGRIDHQVKIRGHRIELGEIESILKKYQGIHSHLLVLRDDDGQKRLVAYYVLNDNTVSSEDIKQYLKLRLPDYMIPTAYVELDRIPLTKNGKVDRKALAKPEDSEKQNVAPRTEQEALLSDIWCQCLGLSKVNVRQNFFELGGDSILSIKIVSLVRKAGYELSQKQFFSFPTVEQQASVMVKKNRSFAEEEDYQGVFRLSPIQQWFFGHNFKNVNHWNQMYHLVLPEIITRKTLECLLTNLMEHHDSLRLRFKKLNGKWIQYYSMEKKAKRPSFSESIEAAQRGLNIETGPVFRVVFQDNNNEIYFIAHHLIIDTVSWHILAEDFLTLYGNFKQGKKGDDLQKSNSFKTWVHYLAQNPKKVAKGPHISFWRSRSVRPLIEKKGILNNVNNAGNISTTINKKLSLHLQTIANNKYGTRTHELMLSALVACILRLIDTEIIAIDVEDHGRRFLHNDLDSGIEFDRTIGWFTNIIPVVVKIKPQQNEAVSSDSFLEKAIIKVKESFRKSLTYGLEYGIMKYNICDDRLNNMPNPSISYNYFSKFDHKGNEGGIVSNRDALHKCIAAENERTHLLDVSLLETGDGIIINLFYCKELLKAGFMSKILDQYLETIQKIVELSLIDSTKILSPSDITTVALSQNEINFISNQPAGVTAETDQTEEF